MKVIYNDPTKEEKLCRFRQDSDGLLLGDFGNKIIKEEEPNEFYSKYIEDIRQRSEKI